MIDIRVAVIGAGVSGLVSIKACLEEGLVPVCFEQCAQLGGMWDTSDKQSATSTPQPYSSLITNTSKMMTCFSDLPFSEDIPTFMTVKMMSEYLLRYADHFNLRKYIQFKTKIHQISKARDYDETGNWEVGIEDSYGKRRVEVFNAVMICSGCFMKPRYADIDGMDRFKGKVEHAMTFKDGADYKDKTVFVIGNSFSAGDISTAVCEYANQVRILISILSILATGTITFCGIAAIIARVYLSVGKGCILLRRFDESGIPWDMRILKRVFCFSSMTTYLMNLIMTLSKLSVNHDIIGLHSQQMFPFCPMMISDEISIKIMTGKVKVIGTIVKMEEKKVHIDDGSVVNDVDLVLCATGYDRSLPFLDETLIDSPQAIGEGKKEWYKLVFPVHLRHPSLAMIGQVTADGANLPIYEMQSRFAARVLSGNRKLPAKSVMLSDIERWNSIFKARFSYYKHQVPYLPYIEELAGEIGVKPTFWKLLCRHPRLAFSCLFDAASPVQYRLVGPHSNAMAVNYCNDVYKNTFSGVQHRKVPPRKYLSVVPTCVKLLFPAIALGILYYYVQIEMAE